MLHTECDENTYSDNSSKNSIAFNIFHEFYNYQYRKDMIDKFNVCTVNELDLPLNVRISRRSRFTNNVRLRQFQLLLFRLSFELITGQSSSFHLIRQNERVKRSMKISRKSYLYEFFCNLTSSIRVFNFIGILYCFRFFRRSRLYPFIFNHKNKNDFFVFLGIRERNFFFIPKLFSYKRRNSIRISFYTKNNTVLKKSRLLFYFYLMRLRIVRKVQRTKRKEKRIKAS